MTTKLTLMQKLLGKNYKWWYLIKYSHTLETKYLLTNLFYFLGSASGIWINFLIWKFNLASEQTLRELLLAGLFFALTSSTIYWQIGRDISSGNITRLLVIPSSTKLIWLFSNLGWFPSVIFYNFVALLPLFIYLNFLPSIASLILIIFLSAVGFLIRFCIGLILGFSSFWTIENTGQISFYQNLLPLLIGVLIPYRYFPALIQNILSCSPFGFIIHHPMQIYLGKYDFNQTIIVFAGGIAWCIILYFLAKWIFKLGLKRNEAVGL